MNTVRIKYDGSWLGLFTVIYASYIFKWEPQEIISDQDADQQLLFATPISVDTQEENAHRVLAGLRQKVGNEQIKELYYAFLSELPQVHLLIFRLVKLYFSEIQKQSGNYANDLIMQLKKLVRSVSRERHRMKAFMRFEKMSTGLYFAVMEPDFNVLPLIIKHFKDRYADQEWLIYDLKRKFGAYYNLQEVVEITLDYTHQSLESRALLHADDEQLYADLWKRYFQAVNIKERKNMRLHIQEVPKRYWKYLSEKRLD